MSQKLNLCQRTKGKRQGKGKCQKLRGRRQKGCKNENGKLKIKLSAKHDAREQQMQWVPIMTKIRGRVQKRESQKWKVSGKLETGSLNGKMIIAAAPNTDQLLKGTIPKRRRGKEQKYRKNYQVCVGSHHIKSRIKFTAPITKINVLLCVGVPHSPQGERKRVIFGFSLIPFHVIPRSD